ncbi:MAG TPA: hypothetical protein VF884_11160 [Nitrososphaeraceae archaeon]
MVLFNEYWRLKAVDSVQASDEIHEDSRKKIMNNIVSDNDIKMILMSEP